MEGEKSCIGTCADQKKILIAQITCVIENLMLKISRKEQRDLEEIIQVLSQFAKWLRDDVTSKPVLVQCFVAHPELVTALVTMLDDICAGVLQNDVIIYTISYNAAYCAMMVHELLRQVTDVSSVVLMEATKAGIVRTMLTELNILKAKLGHSKVFNLLITAIFGLIQNFAAKQEVLIYFRFTRFDEILPVYLNVNDKGLYLMCLITLACLIEITPRKSLDILALNSEEISSFVEIFCEASTEHDLVAREVYDARLVVPVEDMLVLFKHLCHVQVNQVIIKDYISMILMCIELCINNGGDDHVLAALDLLWTLISELSISANDLGQNGNSTLITINNLAKRKDKPSISSVALCVLQTLTPVETKDSSLLLLLSEGAYERGRYGECIRWSEMLINLEQNDHTKAPAKVLSGKSYFHMYRREQWFFQDSLPELSSKEFHLQSSSVYSKAKKAVIDLGEAFEIDSSLADKESLYILDISTIDLVCHTNGLKDIGRCLLCQKKSKLLRSHLCPDAVLRAFATGLTETQTKRVFNLSFFRGGEMKSPHTIVKWLFCQKCEEVLSKDGETHFTPKLFHKVYSVRNYREPGEEMVIDYGKWLYRFALGIVFRSLVNEAIASFANDDEIYKLFIQCRKLLLTESLLDKALEKPCIYLLVSPNSPSTDAGFIGSLHNAPFVFALTNKCLKTGRQTTPYAHFLLSRIGIFNFLVLFKPAEDVVIANEYIIHAEGGKYVIPSENCREMIIPKGVTSVLDSLAVVSQKNLMEIDKANFNIFYKALHPGNDKMPPSEIAKEAYGILPAIESDFGKIVRGELTNHFSAENPQNIDLLPKGMEIQRYKKLVVLPENHFIVFHGTFTGETKKSNRYNGTLFLVSGDDPREPYALMLCEMPGLTVSLGFAVSPETLVPIRLLQDQNPKIFLSSIADHLMAFGCIWKALPHFLKRNGLTTYTTVIHHSYLKWDVTYDLVCEQRCWYCEQRCNNCLKPSFSVYDLSHPRMPLMKFCSKSCQEIYSLGQLPFLSTSNASPHPMLFNMNIPLELKPKGFSYAHISVFLGDGSKFFPKRDAYVVYQHRAPFSQTFLEYFLTNDLSVSHPLEHYNEEDMMLALQEKSDVTFIGLALEAELKRMKINNLKSFIDEKLRGEKQAQD